MKRYGILALLFLALFAVGASACGGDEGGGSAAPTGDAFDKAFIDAMVPHHESAIDMARSADVAGLTQPDLQRVADDILANQQAEIDQMKRWREEWFGSAEIDPEGAAALAMSEDEMGMTHDPDALLNSGEVDKDFAVMMIDHHEGAVAMAELALDRAEHEELRRLAQAIIDAQEREIEVMKPHASGMHHGG